MNSPYPETMTKQELLDRIRKSRAAYKALWQGLTEEQMTRVPGPTPEWSVKDLIAHTVWWETFTIARVTLMLAGQEVLPIEEFDHINALIHGHVKDLSLAHILQDFESNLPRLEALIASMTEGQLNDTDGFNVHGRSPLRLLGGNTFGHYGEHGPDLARYVSSLKPK
ncbi:MAG: DinB family protein [Chloroflexi bacterium]|nr:DinB family protein [Chloroflexota bacterium]